MSTIQEDIMEGNKKVSIWEVKFAYSGSSRREFYTTNIASGPGEDINALIKKYVQHQNRGEAKSDRIKFWSKKKLVQPNPSNL